jgi:hypothetical protein
MAASTKEEAAMRRKKRFTIKMVALGFAVAALSAPAAQAIPEGMQSSDLRSLHDNGIQLVVSPDDRVIHGMTPPVVKSPDDRAVHGTTSVQPTTQPVSADDSGWFEFSNNTLTTGIVLALLLAAMGGYAARQVRKAGKLAGV